MGGGMTRITNITNNYNRALNNSNQQLTQHIAHHRSLVHRLATTVGQMYILFMAAKKVANIFAEWYKKSNDFIENMNLFEVTMRDNTDAALEYAESVERIMGIDLSDWLSYQGKFQQLSKGFGVASDAANVMSQNLTQLSYDLSSFFNVDVEKAFQKLSSAMAGQVKGLREYGIDVSNASLQQYALSKGIDLTVRNMNQAQKSVLRYNYILEKSVNIQGDLARTIVTPANALRILGAQMEKLKRTLGNIISVIVTQFIPYVQAGVTIITRFAERIANAFGFEMPKLDYSGLDDAVSVEDDLSEYAEDISDNFADATQEVKKFKNQLMGFDELNILKAPTDDVASKVKTPEIANIYPDDLGLGIPSYDFGLDRVNNQADKVIEDLKSKFALVFAPFYDSYVKYVKPAIDTVHNSFMRVVDMTKQWFKDLNLQPFIDAVNNLLSGTQPFVDFFTQTFEWVWGNVVLDIAKRFVELDLPNIINLLYYAGQGVLGVLKGIADIFKPLWTNIIKPALDKISEVSKLIIDKVGPKFQELGEKIGNALSKWQPIIDKISAVLGPIVTKILDLLGGFLGGALEAGLDSLGKIFDGIGGLADMITGLFEGDYDKIVEGSRKLGEGIWEALIAPFKHIGTAIAGAFSGLWDSNMADFAEMGVDYPQLLSDMGNSIGTFFSDLWSNVSGFFVGVWESVSGFFTDLWGNITGFFSKVGNWFSEMWGALSKGWHTVIDPWIEIIRRASIVVKAKVIDPIVGFFKGLWESVSGFFSSLWEDVVNIWSTAADWFNTTVITPVKNFFGGVWGALTDGAEEAWRQIQAVFSHVADFFGNIFSNAWKKVQEVFSAGGRIFEGIKEGVSRAFTGVVNSLIDGLNNIVGNTFYGLNNALDFIHNVEILGVKPFSYINRVEVPQIPKIPTYAQGGLPETGEMFIARESGAEMVGTIGNHTAVANNDQIVTAIEAAVFRAMSQLRNNSSTTVNATLEIDGEAMARKTFTVHNDEVLRTGASPLLI